MKKTSLFAIVLFLLLRTYSACYAQSTGKVSGKISDKSSGETLIGATISVQGTDKAAAADVNGDFTLNVTPGRYTLTVKYIGYQAKEISEVEISAATVTRLNVALEAAASQTLKGVTIVSTYRKETVGALYAVQKNNAAITDGISAEIIRSTPDKNTSEVLKRVSGATVQDNKFVIIRGLSDRYNTALLDNTPLPSTEPNRKAFSFDIVPSSLVDNVIISKTATPNLPGDFAGGAVQINTRDIPEENFTTLSLGYTYNTQTTFKNFRSGYRNASDYFAFDNGSRKLPASFPTTQQVVSSSLSPQQNISALNSLNPDYNIYHNKAIPGQNYQLSIGQVKETSNGNKLGAIIALTYRNSQQTNPDVFRDFYTFRYSDQQYKFSTNVGALANFAYTYGKNKITFKNIYNRIFDDQFLYRQGENSAISSDVQYYAFDLIQKALFKSTIEGEHAFGDKNSKLKWTAGYSNIINDQPDQRKTSYSRNVIYRNDPSVLYTANVQGTIGKENARLFSYLSENIYSADLNYSLPLTMFNQPATFKTGAGTQYRKRNFDVRFLGLLISDRVLDGDERNAIAQRPLPTLFGTDLINAGKYDLKEINGDADSYDANSNVSSGYLMLDNKLGEKVRLVWGARVEYFNLNLTAAGPSIPVTKLNNVDLLPSANFTYSITPRANFRVSYYRTLARPEFRELARTSYYDYELLALQTGNPNLKRALIDNADIRYEFYPSAGQIISISGFYKKFTNAIESNINDVNASTPEISYLNVKKATTYGLEFELRKKLEFIGDQQAFKNTTLYTNLSLVKSEVQDPSLIGKKRPMVGQSPYVINAGILHTEFDQKLSFNLLYNRIGGRIFKSRGANFPNVYESPRNVLDFQVGYKTFKNRGEFKLNAADLLNNKYQFFLDYDENGKFSGADRVFSRYKQGSNISLVFTYSFR
ncbi:MAG TPA: TonB-dependent receptor [Mucilaginibacter sp.]|nr:TonB-dependent receptor [Mucilaginibacter sp.]